MRVCVLGLWHLGSVTAAAVASLGHDVIAHDANQEVVKNLRIGRPPVGEPGLPELIREQRDSERLEFTNDMAYAIPSADIVWITYDTLVDADDRADVGAVLQQVERTFPYLRDGAIVMISSQLPVGSTRELERRWHAASPACSVHFAYSPENLRLGKALNVFLNPDRIIVGVRQLDSLPEVKHRIATLYGPLSDRILWMRTESAEMTKHALNAFLATSVTFINEIATISEAVGADAREVELGLKSEHRIGINAYLRAGAAFSGGTLARDVNYLRQQGVDAKLATPMLDGLIESNSRHRSWALNNLADALGGLEGRRIAIWGLTYKPGTTTLRRSDAVLLCHELVARGAEVSAHDPAVSSHPVELSEAVKVCQDPVQTAHGASALVLSTAWPEYLDVSRDTLSTAMKRQLVVDADRFLATTIGADRRFEYITVGRRS